MAIKSKVNGLIIGSSVSTNEVVKLGGGKFAEPHFPSRSQKKKTATKKTEIEFDIEHLDEVELDKLPMNRLREIGIQLQLGLAGGASKATMIEAINCYLGENPNSEQEGQQEVEQL